jgi:hypothetical protein
MAEAGIRPPLKGDALGRGELFDEIDPRDGLQV